MLCIEVASSHPLREVAGLLSEFDEVVYVLRVSRRFDLMVEVVCDSTKSFQYFLERPCVGYDDIDQFEIMAGIEMFKNQFLLKCQAL